MVAATVEISDVSKAFGPTVALDSVSLRASAGEIHAIIGGNGSGKSTLAKVISGVLVPDSGHVSILGKSASTPFEARELGISNVFQEVLVADECSVLDNLYLGADSLLGTPVAREERYHSAGELMTELLGFELDLDAPVGELSLSIKQWVTIARAILTDPKVLILDESSAALDFDSTERLFNRMRKMKAEGCTIMIVTHRIAELVRIADSATVLRDGSAIGTLAGEDISETRIVDMIAGKEQHRHNTSQDPVSRLSDHPLLRVINARVWAAASSFDFTVYPGEIVGITGLDGHGHADFVRAIAGVQTMAQGRITMVRNDTAVTIDSLQTARESGIAYVSGDRAKEGIFANLSIFENLLMPVYREYRAGGWLNLINRTKLRPVFAWESGRLDVRMGSPGDLVTSLSGGNQQKVLIARAFAEKPSILVLNDPARGIDIGAKRDLYLNLRAFAARGNAVVFLSSEIEEFLNLCNRVHVFRNGALSAEFSSPLNDHDVLNAMFGRRSGISSSDGHDPCLPAQPSATMAPVEHGRPDGRPLPLSSADVPEDRIEPSDFLFYAPDFPSGSAIPDRHCKSNSTSPALCWSGVPPGTRSFALSVTDPDVPEDFNLSRSFAHWLVCNIPGHIRELPEGASVKALPGSALELNCDFVTFAVPGFGRGWGGPWPPDKQHRYVFTLYALKVSRIDIAADADFAAFGAAVLPVAIDHASFTAVYGPARTPLPAA